MDKKTYYTDGMDRKFKNIHKDLAKIEKRVGWKTLYFEILRYQRENHKDTGYNFDKSKAMSKILYSPKEGTSGFWGLRNVPAVPWDMKAYEEALESCKSNSLEIVNPGVLNIVSDMKDGLWFSGGNELKSGDIFDLPEGYEFSPDKKQEVYDMDGHAGIRYIEVLHLVKTETFKERFTKLFPQPEPEAALNEVLKEIDTITPKP